MTTHRPDSGLPPEFDDLDAALRGARLEPRASLEPEIAGRFARGERAARRPSRKRMMLGWAAAAAVAVIALGAAVRGGYVPALDALAATKTTNVCCQDLDGVGGADDGVIVETVGGKRVRRLVVYEEHDKDRTWTPGETVRFTRPAAPTLFAPKAGDTLVTHQFCCGDYDGGGVPDDGVLVVASADGNVLMAALFDRDGYPTQNQLR